MQRNIRHQFFFPHPTEIVWDYLTDPNLLSQWLMPNDFMLRVGHRFQFNARPKIDLGFDGTIYCEVLQVVPLKKLVYSWKGGMGKERPTLDSVVTWTLAASDGGTVLVLEHTGFKGLKNYLAYVIMNKGWIKIGKRWLSKM